MSELISSGVVRFRQGVPADYAYVQDSWLRARWAHIESEDHHLSPAAECRSCHAKLRERRQHPKQGFVAFAEHMRRVQADVCSRATLSVAHPDDDAGQILAFVVHSPGPTIHWCQTKLEFRRKGIVKHMLSEIVADAKTVYFTNGTTLWPRLELQNWVYVPIEQWRSKK